MQSGPASGRDPADQVAATVRQVRLVRALIERHGMPCQHDLSAGSDSLPRLLIGARGWMLRLALSWQSRAATCFRDAKGPGARLADRENGSGMQAGCGQLLSSGGSSGQPTFTLNRCSHLAVPDEAIAVVADGVPVACATASAGTRRVAEEQKSGIFAAWHGLSGLCGDSGEVFELRQHPLPESRLPSGVAHRPPEPGTLAAVAVYLLSFAGLPRSLEDGEVETAPRHRRADAPDRLPWEALGIARDDRAHMSAGEDPRAV